MLHHSIRLSFAISIHTPLAGSDRQREHTDRCGEISIHTPLAGSDVLDGAEFGAFGVISIHTPLAGSD